MQAFEYTLGYTIQLYFDFSGYSDMAVGISRLFGIQIPLNFNAPYKAISIIEFWRRWHISLSQFLRDYIYIPLGGGRCTSIRRYTNLLITMAIGGLWHGASWNFILWGMYHGILLALNHGIRYVFPKKEITPDRFKFFKILCTFFCVMLGWVLFKSNDIPQAISIYKGLFGFNGIIFADRVTTLIGWIGIGVLWIICISETHLLSEKILTLFDHNKSKKLHLLVALGACMFVLSLSAFFKVQTFLYWTF